MELDEGELEIWCETLKAYSFQEFDKAMKHLIEHPPKYQLDDGSIQVWRGMPKLPDVVQVMLEFREKREAEYFAMERKKEQEKIEEYYKQVKEHPEDFLKWTDLLKKVETENPEAFKKHSSIDRNGVLVPIRGWPDRLTNLTDAEVADRLEILRQQKEKILAKEKAAEISDKGEK